MQPDRLAVDGERSRYAEVVVERRDRHRRGAVPRGDGREAAGERRETDGALLLTGAAVVAAEGGEGVHFVVQYINE